MRMPVEMISSVCFEARYDRERRQQGGRKQSPEIDRIASPRASL